MQPRILVFLCLVFPKTEGAGKISFKNFLLDTCPFVSPLISLFWTSGDVSSRFQSQSVQPYSRLLGGVKYISSLIFTSGATPLPVYNGSIAASPLPHMRVSAEVKFLD